MIETVCRGSNCDSWIQLLAQMIQLGLVSTEFDRQVHIHTWLTCSDLLFLNMSIDSNSWLQAVFIVSFNISAVFMTRVLTCLTFSCTSSKSQSRLTRWTRNVKPIRRQSVGFLRLVVPTYISSVALAWQCFTTFLANSYVTLCFVEMLGVGHRKLTGDAAVLSQLVPLPRVMIDIIACEQYSVKPVPATPTKSMSKSASQVKHPS